MRVSVLTLYSAMIAAARKEASAQWPAAREIASAEVRKLASTVVYVKNMVATGHITVTRARALVRMQETAARDALRTLEGIGILTARRTIAAAMRAAGALVDLKDPRGKVHGPAVQFKAGKDL